ncbi:bifunctional pyr operon transcriptional regulator/uracil phosphoribosyltransferase PyrR [Acidipropionibacterium jensenii]|uniref:Bifunctional protein PyrR n=1 Tax=Acidipropionibacterium jensenii TaxID=1749 RepID=A0A3T0RZN4_9ACTN|nr:bifunctional pyr operon transcriptional regulator/uracil phosphoribosyltransferase PyrR [Acidipropionibacterium jensenii]AZZ39586.1 bifunctional pyr operon transcriptional regulator/uracil phosphoribosyltransferase PyrR [Acidipropionibacterium jensenii]AZZ41990.1 bifunctional pyr operon transcriptional regulator/uracil phosphoribosyltransferase PyrR [Acidipropionibacterium jensenii]MDN5976988.1 bifunctional pyr operon transcriptional regulator/uracil phosphoribosyltransferase PyrR [Acidipropi
MPDQLPDDEVLVMDADAMRRALTRICYEIVERNRGAEQLLLAGVRSRGAQLAARMAARLGEVERVAVPAVDLDVRAYRDDLVEERFEAQFADPNPGLPEDLSGLTVIIVDDVLYTGRTTRAAIDAVMDVGRPAAVQLAVLVDRGHRELPIRADFVGKNLPTAVEEQVVVRVAEVDGLDEVAIRKAARR